MTERRSAGETRLGLANLLTLFPLASKYVRKGITPTQFAKLASFVWILFTLHVQEYRRED